MWVLEKIRESMESLPLELSRYMGKSEEDTAFPSKASLSQSLHNNVLTPDKIPEFCLPPRLCKRSPLVEAEKNPPFVFNQKQIPKSSHFSATTHVKTKDVKTKNGDTSLVWKATKKPLPFSAEGYGLAGIYESPNTRRKESLFHSKRPVYVLDRNMPTAAPRLTKEAHLPKKSLSGFLPVFLCKSLSETWRPSSSDSSPLSSPYCVKSSLYGPPNSGRLKGTVSCPSLIDNKEDRGKWKRGGLTASPSSPSSLKKNSANLTPPVLFPLDVLQCQERLEREHVLPLQGRGRVRLSAEHATFSSSMSSLFSTVRVRVVSVEGLWNDTDRQTLNCAVSLCLTPGKLQQQESAIIRNCRSPVFNEDFYFTELSQKDLLEMQLRLKVVDKAAAGTLRRGTVIGVITKPLSQLLILNEQYNV
ncbi:C2 calcium-dependent domain-containing protein 4C [Archocentrus centrarchus]|uniref:C2 calcium-dependent domain-containing protein 4C n=1 Tax=Archocentrus centrarchus TaxID=63155 RepID=UPI0011E9D25B|nr:C2 calcium-dependent domain-containing protein 4C-like [Archocentrus centrarchus]